MIWKCVDCGHESESRWLMCPECTTPEDWAEIRAQVNIEWQAREDVRRMWRAAFGVDPS